jgi:hypothetical protein
LAADSPIKPMEKEISPKIWLFGKVGFGRMGK